MTVKFVLICFCLAPAWAVAQKKITNSIGMEFVLIDTGSFVVGEFYPPYPVPADTVKANPHPYIMYMGQGRGYNAEEFRLAKEMAMKSFSDGVRVRLSRPYYMGTTEVTQAQWRRVMGDNPSQFKGLPGSDSLPVESVSWKDAQQFIKKLNQLEKRSDYRLPSEAEWEYAARAGAEKDIPWGEIDASANLNKTTPVAVASKKPNAWGLYDMLGNVWEWVDDYYNEKLFADLVPPKKTKHHVLKGASFVCDVKNATYMTHAGGPGNGWDVGFRIVMDVDQHAK